MEEQVITGTVIDPSGAVVPGTKVTITNLATRIKTELVTNADGIYRSPSLRPAEYQMDISKEGFQTLVRRGLTLHLAELLRLDVTLQIGSASQTVEVTGGAPVLNLEDARIGQLVEQKAVQSYHCRTGGRVV